ncbi:DNA recombination protein RmuC [Accumulibacter sp.]|jgi:DNA recombination protein RmuC|uniref:DNA recombination protein RmuC n=1 Tax=Accumulibacter sp. TaxID=2053492 RepID=UPI001AC819A1|nr:DNA recombination protein RmuC [Accumulibacter sp.]MBN8454810.1 DNA recombination protein RmuC [Accumulibacter sp.]MBO3706442.1 DNA recombination protein RmuC [Candidatus Accumulibacter conexus]
MSEGILQALLGIGVALLVLQVLVLARAAHSRETLDAGLRDVQRSIGQVERELREELARGRQEAVATARGDREEQTLSLGRLSQALAGELGRLGELQAQQLESFAQQLSRLTNSNEQRFESLRLALEARLSLLQGDNARKLEEIRQTVDEKLHATLEQRLGDSFRLVSDRLEQVHRGLGEMQTLATGVGDLKRVLSNVKTRGTWGEVQLDALLDQLLTGDQYARNVATRPNRNDRVEFAIRLPGADGQQPVWLPIDAKFPLEDHQRLVDAQERNDPAALELATRALEGRLRDEAKKIRDKYVEPPYTTDFAILYLPTEGLYAEVLRRPGLVDGLQRDLRICIAGPTTLAALLNSLQMGFRTLAIERRSSEVWAVLGAVKTEFGRFGEVLEATRRKLEQASRSIESAGVRTRQIERKLKNVEALPVEEAQRRLGDLEEVADADPPEGGD